MEVPPIPGDAGPPGSAEAEPPAGDRAPIPERPVRRTDRDRFRSLGNRRLRVSVVVPAFDEEASVAPLVAEVRRALEGAGFAYELVLVDDGSRDGTLDAMLRAAAGDPAVRVLQQWPKRGQSAALATGWRAARAPVVVTMDADLQNDPADVPRLLAVMEEGYDVVSGVRVPRRDPWLRRASSRIANAVRNRVTGASVTDVGCTLRACRTELLLRVPVFDGMHRFLPTLLELAGGRLAEVPVAHRPRRFGRTKYGVRNRLGRGLLDLLAVRWLQARWIDPRGVRELSPVEVSAREGHSASAPPPPDRPAEAEATLQSAGP